MFEGLTAKQMLEAIIEAPRNFLVLEDAVIRLCEIVDDMEQGLAIALEGPDPDGDDGVLPSSFRKTALDLLFSGEAPS